MNKLVYDVGATNLKFAVMTDAGDVLRRQSIPVPRGGLDDYLNAFCALAQPDLEGCDGVAISTNGRMTPDGDTYRAYTMDFLTGVNLREALEARLHLPVAVENDGLSATLGEWWHGAGRGAKNMMGVVLGSGMGAGLILDGRPYRGSRRNAAMVFGLLAASDPKANTYLASGFTTSFPLVIYQAAATKRQDPRAVTGHDVFRWAEAGDPAALRPLELYCRSVAASIFNSHLLLDLDCIVLTGGLAAQPLLVEGVRRSLKEIAARAFTMDGLDPAKVGIRIDPADFNVHLIRGELMQDANLHGALYHLLHR